jgi:hypothetical protein
MKNSIIFTILILLFGFVEVYAQQTDSGMQTDNPVQKSDAVDRSTQSPNPPTESLPGLQGTASDNESLSSLQATASISEPGKSDGYKSPNPSEDPDAVLQAIINLPETSDIENQGPRPSDPNAVRPETK